MLVVSMDVILLFYVFRVRPILEIYLVISHFFKITYSFTFFFTTVSFSLSHQKSSKITFAICLLSTAKS